MELRLLRQFVAVAEAGSFRLAAERLFMAQPPLSVAIQRLEREIGVKLFERGARGVRLTAPGALALDAARKCLRDAEDVVSSARAADQGEAGHLRVAFIGSVTFGLMPRIVQAFRSRYPNVRLELREATNREALVAVQGGTMDLGFVRVPALCPPGVALQTIQQDVFCAALPAAHPLTRRRTLRLADLRDQPLIGYLPSQPGGGLHAAVTHLFMRAGISPTVTQEAVQVHTVIGLVDSGLGMALVPSVNARRGSAGVAFRPLRDLPADASIGIALAHVTAGESTVARRFREVVSAAVGTRPS
ncbi:LysR family transcriptional regulator [Piscinibacter sp.]|uniref:LysR family transcriptional regulator n=1 Tax=Piscinibacter sp. TaxID=1903157 RepID=UPI002C244F11|nr:LysR family transcriptional regulator [Albitalea sp.]HUG21701.1 LysR family transcriptional regulator [Albitalea sp.]